MGGIKRFNSRRKKADRLPFASPTVGDLSLCTNLKIPGKKDVGSTCDLQQKDISLDLHLAPVSGQELSAVANA